MCIPTLAVLFCIKQICKTPEMPGPHLRAFYQESFLRVPDDRGATAFPFFVGSGVFRLGWCNARGFVLRSFGWGALLHPLGVVPQECHRMLVQQTGLKCLGFPKQGTCMKLKLTKRMQTLEFSAHCTCAGFLDAKQREDISLGSAPLFHAQAINISQGLDALEKPLKLGGSHRPVSGFDHRGRGSKPTSGNRLQPVWRCNWVVNGGQEYTE